MKASATMTRRVACVKPGDTLRSAWKLMQKLGVRHLPVVQGSTLEGVLSDRDILVYSKPTPDGLWVPKKMAVERAMTSLPVTCRPNAPVSEVAALMLEHKIDCIPVTDRHEILVGLVTSTDLLALLTESGGSMPFVFRLEMPDE